MMLSILPNLLQVPLNSVAGRAGCRSGDYLVKIAGQDVFGLSHDQAKKVIASAGDKLTMVIERQVFSTYTRSIMHEHAHAVRNRRLLKLLLRQMSKQFSKIESVQTRLKVPRGRHDCLYPPLLFLPYKTLLK